VIFNQAGASQAARATAAEVVFNAVAFGTTVDQAMDNIGVKVIALGERRTFTFPEGSECTNVYMTTDVALGGTNNRAIVELTI
jgi:hypothetical protein